MVERALAYSARHGFDPGSSLMAFVGKLAVAHTICYDPSVLRRLVGSFPAVSPRHKDRCNVKSAPRMWKITL